MSEKPGPPSQPSSLTDTFDLWATSDAHIVREALGEGFDPKRVPRESMAAAIAQAEGPDGFHYDIGFQLGDLLDYDHETAANFQAYRRQLASSKKDPHCWYHLGGNNDENSVLNDGVAIDNEHYRRYIDPVGEFTESSGISNDRRPFPVVGTYERYHMDVGNIRFLFLSDRNDLPAPYGRGEGGFFVDGAITLESFEWLVRQIITYPERILVVACHHPLKNTTIGSGIDDSWAGQFMTNYNPKHENNPHNRLQSTLHQIYPIAEFDTPLFRHLLGQNPGAVDIWMSGHVHHLVEQTFAGRGKYAAAFGGHHLNIGNLCRYRHFSNIISAQSTLFSWTVNQPEVLSRVYVHDHPELPTGFYMPEQRTLSLKCAFVWQAEARAIDTPTHGIRDWRAETTGPDQWQMRWDCDSTGMVIVRSAGEGLPLKFVDGEVYYTGMAIPSGEVVFAGTARESHTLATPDEETYFYAVPYNAGNGQVRYNPKAAVRLKLSRDGTVAI